MSGVATNPNNVIMSTISPSGDPFFLIAGSNGFSVVTPNTNSDGAGAMIALGGPNSWFNFSQVKSITFCGDRTLVARIGKHMYGIAGLDSGIPDPSGRPPIIAWDHELPFFPGMIVSAVSEIAGVGAHAMMAFSSDLRTIYTFSADPQWRPQLRTLPAAMPIDPARIDVTTIIHDQFGVLWFAQKGDTHVTALKPSGVFTQHQLPVEAIDGFALDDFQHLLIVENSVVRCFALGTNGYADAGLNGSMFAGQMVGNGFTVARNTHNFDLRYHTGPEWEPSPELPICLGDVNFDGMVNAADLSVMLSDWGSCKSNCPGDLNADGVVDAADLSEMLSTWGACPD